MKYMGSKKNMLENGLGVLLIEQAAEADRFVDLFCGSASVSWFVATKTNKPVISVDMQAFSSVLALAVTSRTKKINSDMLINRWVIKAVRNRNRSSLWSRAVSLEESELIIPEYVIQSRRLCESTKSAGPVWTAYGGHYFSPKQAITFDFLISALPLFTRNRLVCLAAIIMAASECAASPGHTAQPFQPTDSSGKYLIEAWSRDPIVYIKKALGLICPLHAKSKGEAFIGDALDFCNNITDRDLVFIDPPYSNVQYSRFYHVLETIARGKSHVEVSGVGRYPSFEQRPQSKFSNSSTSQSELERLLKLLAQKRCKVVFTFPAGEASNGLSGRMIFKVASQWFDVKEISMILGQFSTLGGNNVHRDARNISSENIYLLIPRG